MPQKNEKAEERKRHRVLSKNESARWVGVLDVELSEITPRKPQYRKTQRERKERPQIWPNPPCITPRPLALSWLPHLKLSAPPISASPKVAAHLPPLTYKRLCGPRRFKRSKVRKC